MRKQLIAGALGAAAVAAAVSLAPSASATPSDYYSQLRGHGMQIWDYPEMLRQGYAICDMLWYDVNPMPYLTRTVGYDMYTANNIIGSAQAGLCPGNAVTS